MKGAHNVVDGQCLDCGLKESDTHDSFPIETYCCIPNDWRALPDVPSNVRLYLAAAKQQCRHCGQELPCPCGFVFR